MFVDEMDVPPDKTVLSHVVLRSRIFLVELDFRSGESYMVLNETE